MNVFNLLLAEKMIEFSVFYHVWVEQLVRAGL